MFVLGHEDRHALHAKTSQDELNIFQKSVDTIAAQPGLQDYTHVLITLQTAYATDEALANIAGWNSVVSFVNYTNATPTGVDYYYAAGGYGNYFVTASGNSLPNLIFNSDYSVSTTDTSVAAEADLYFYNSQTKLGQYGINYSTWYILNNLKYILQVAATNTVEIDMKTLHVDGLAIKNANLLQLSPNQTYTVFDPVAHHTYVFSGAEDGGSTLKDSHPVVLAGGQETETQKYGEGNELESVTHTWSKDNGSSGSDVTDALGNFNSSSIDAANTSSWTYSRIDGSHGSGYHSTNVDYNESYNSDGSFNKSLNNHVTGERFSSFKNSDGSYGDSEINADGSTHEYLYHSDGSFIDESTNRITGENSTNYKNSDGSYGDHEVFADGSKHEYTMQANGTYNDIHNYSDGSSSTIYSSLDGTYIETTYGANGDYYNKFKNSSGDEYITKDNSDGSSHSSYERSDGSNGYTDRETDGTYDEYDYSANGSFFYASKDDVGTVTLQYDDGLGNFHGETKYANGTEEIENDTFDGSNKTTHIRADGVANQIDMKSSLGTYHFALVNNVGSDLTTYIDGSSFGKIEDHNTGSMLNFTTDVNGVYKSQEIDIDGKEIDIKSDLTGFQSVITMNVDGTSINDIIYSSGGYSHLWANTKNGDFTSKSDMLDGNLGEATCINGIYNVHSLTNYTDLGQATFDVTTSETGYMVVHITTTPKEHSGEDITYTGFVGGQFHEVGLIGSTKVDQWLDGPVAGPNIPIVYVF